MDWEYFFDEDDCLQNESYGKGAYGKNKKLKVRQQYGPKHNPNHHSTKTKLDRREKRKLRALEKKHLIDGMGNISSE